MRKSLLALLMLLMLVAVACAPAGDSAPAADSSGGGDTAAAVDDSDPLTYWVGLTFSDPGNQLVVDRINQFGEEKGIPVEAVVINQNEMVQKVSAAIESGTLPDAIDIRTGLALQLVARELIIPVDDLFEKVGNDQGGWLNAASVNAQVDDFGGQIYGIPYGTGGNVLYRRMDVLEPAGFTDAPETWLELAEMAAAAQTPPENYGMGFALSNVGDANMTTSMLQSFGGRVADDEGKTCTVDSPETREFLEWITPLYTDGLFPPGVATWDGAGDNTCYQSAQCVFIANPGSVYVYMRENDPELGDMTRYSPFPAGPVLHVSPANTNFRVVTAGDKEELAKELVEYLMDPDFLSEYYRFAIYGAVLEDQLGFEIFTESPVHAGLTELAQTGTPGAWPDVDNTAFGEYQNSFITPKMVLRVAVDGMSIDEAVTEAQASCQEIYDKYQ